MSETEVTVRGHLGTNPALQKSATGKSWLRMRVATNRRIRQADGWVDGPTSWYDVKVWDAFAQNIAESLRKGDRVIVQGPLEIEEYTNDQGTTFRTAVIHARAMGPDLTGATVRLMKVQRGASAEDSPVDVSGMSEVPEGFEGADEPNPETESSSEDAEEREFAAF